MRNLFKKFIDRAQRDGVFNAVKLSIRYVLNRTIFRSYIRVGKTVGYDKAIRLLYIQLKQDPRSIISRDTATRGSVAYQFVRVDHSERWSLISPEISPQAKSVLDIGCNTGKMSRLAADMGLFVIGVDVDKANVKVARALTDHNICHFLHQEISPKNIEGMPSSDIVFLFAVYYHWGQQYGWPEAENMLQHLGSRTNQLFIETPEDLNHIESPRLDTTSDTTDAIDSYFNKLFPEKEVKLLGDTTYTGGDRKDLVFVIE